jgi:hypothetical protein
VALEQKSQDPLTSADFGPPGMDRSQWSQPRADSLSVFFHYGTFWRSRRQIFLSVTTGSWFKIRLSTYARPRQLLEFNNIAAAELSDKGGHAPRMKSSSFRIASHHRLDSKMNYRTALSSQLVPKIKGNFIQRGRAGEGVSGANQSLLTLTPSLWARIPAIME